MVLKIALPLFWFLLHAIQGVPECIISDGKLEVVFILDRSQSTFDFISASARSKQFDATLDRIEKLHPASTFGIASTTKYCCYIFQTKLSRGPSIKGWIAFKNEISMDGGLGLQAAARALDDNRMGWSNGTNTMKILAILTGRPPTLTPCVSASTSLLTNGCQQPQLTPQQLGEYLNVPNVAVVVLLYGTNNLYNQWKQYIREFPKIPISVSYLKEDINELPNTASSAIESALCTSTPLARNKKLSKQGPLTVVHSKGSTLTTSTSSTLRTKLIPIVPTTIVPTTIVPTTIVSTTIAPTTIASTTIGPTTIVSTTIVSTTIGPTTIIPSTSVATTSTTETTTTWSKFRPTTPPAQAQKEDMGKFAIILIGAAAIGGVALLGCLYCFVCPRYRHENYSEEWGHSRWMGDYETKPGHIPKEIRRVERARVWSP